MSSDEGKILHVVWSPFDDAVHVVSAATLVAAQAADAAPVLVDFGDLRRSNDIDELRRRLADHGYGALEDYETAIEHHAGVAPASADIGERLAAISGIDFHGRTAEDYDASEITDLPADGDLFLNEAEQENQLAPEFRGYDVIAHAMSADIPADLFEKYAVARYGDSPVFSGHIDDSVAVDRLPELIAELRARGYVMIED